MVSIPLRNLPSHRPTIPNHLQTNVVNPKHPNLAFRPSMGPLPHRPEPQALSRATAHRAAGEHSERTLDSAEHRATIQSPRAALPALLQAHALALALALVRILAVAPS
jgi:hypothetical protein